METDIIAYRTVLNRTARWKRAISLGLALSLRENKGLMYPCKKNYQDLHRDFNNKKIGSMNNKTIIMPLMCLISE